MCKNPRGYQSIILLILLRGNDKIILLKSQAQKWTIGHSKNKDLILGSKNNTYCFSTTPHAKTTTHVHLNDSKCHIHSILCLGQAAPKADGVQCLKTRYYLNETSIPLLSIILNNEDFTPSDSISGAPSVSICSVGQINKYSLDQVICLMLLTETEILTITLV